jgi:hypothetical protein
MMAMSQLGGRQTAGWLSREKMVAMVQHGHQVFLLLECYCCVFVCVAKKENSRYLEGRVCGTTDLGPAQAPGNLLPPLILRWNDLGASVDTHAGAEVFVRTPASF